MLMKDRVEYIYKFQKELANKDPSHNPLTKTEIRKYAKSGGFLGSWSSDVHLADLLEGTSESKGRAIAAKKYKKSDTADKAYLAKRKKIEHIQKVQKGLADDFMISHPLTEAQIKAHIRPGKTLHSWDSDNALGKKLIEHSNAKLAALKSKKDKMAEKAKTAKEHRAANKAKEVSSNNKDKVAHIKEIQAKLLDGKPRVKPLTDSEIRSHVKAGNSMHSLSSSGDLEKQLKVLLNAKHKANKAKEAPDHVKQAVEDLHKKFGTDKKQPESSTKNAHGGYKESSSMSHINALVDDVVNTFKSKHGKIGLALGAGTVGIAAYMNRGSDK